ncbi:MAG: hypothetical protein MR691_04815 [Clostridium sp.]|nr:hypothetical protein [Clostridium sp.]
MVNKKIMDIYDFLNRFEEILSNFKEKYLEHVEFHEEFLGHVFFGDDICCDIRDIAIKKDELKLKQIFDLIELGLSEGDDYLQEVIVITILVGIHDNEEAWNNSKKYMKKNTIIEANKVEESWG